MANLLAFAKKAIDQINSLDNGKTYQNSQGNHNPGPAPSALHQLTHNGLTNTVGGALVKPFVLNPLQIAAEIPRQIAADYTHNTAAQQAGLQREIANLKASIPGFIANQGINAGQSGYNLGFKAPVLDLRGKTAQAEQARQVGLRELNNTVVGQATRPIQAGIASLSHASPESQAQVGLDPSATGAQKYFADPLMGGLGLTGLAKVPGVLAKTGRDIKVSAQEASAGRRLGKVPQVKASSEGPITAELPKPQNPANIPAFLRLRPPSSKKQMSPAEIKYRQDQQSLRDTGTPAFIRQNKSVAEQLVRQGLPTTAPPEVAGLLPKPSGIAEGPGFTMAPKVNEAVIQIGKQVQQIDRQLEQVRQGKSTKTPDEVRSLVQQRQELVKTVDNPSIAPKTTAPKPSRPEVPKQVANPKAPTPPTLKVLNSKIKNVKDPARKAELVAERDALKTKPAPPGQIPLDLPETSPTLTAAKSPGLLARAFQSTRGIISQFGTAGKEVARRLQEHRFQSEIGQEKFLESIPAVGKLSEDDFRTFVRVLEARGKGQKVTAADHIEKAVAEWNKAIPAIRERALKAGIDVGDLGPNYFPHIYKDLFTSNHKMTKMAESMVRSGKAKSFEDAVGQLRFMQKDYIRTHGNLERSRMLDMPGYEMTHDALTGYVGRAFDRITKAEQFGPNGELIQHAQAHMLKEGYDAGPGTMVDKKIQIALENTDKNTPGYKASSAVRKFNALRSLNTAAISNASQLTNTATVAGISRTLKAIARVASPKSGADARLHAKQAGVELDHTINNLSASQLGVKGKILKNIASPFFHAVEKFNRTVTAVVGEDYGNHLASRAAKGDTKALQELRDKFGIKDEIGSTLTDEQRQRVASGLVERSQFKVDPQDLPGWVDSPLGKLMSQFRTFGYKQTSFMYNEVLREATKGNFTPLGRFIAVGIPAGSASLALKGAIKGQPMTGSNPTSQSLQALAAVGGGGLPGSEGQNLINGIKYNDPVGALSSTVGGPTASFIVETGKNTTTAMKGQGTTPLKKEGLRSIPVIGPAAANRVFPKKVPVSSAPTPAGKTATPAELTAQSNEQVKQLKAKAATPDTVGLTQLPNGKYVTQSGNTVSTHDTLAGARLALAKDKFAQSNDSYKIVGNTVLRRGEDGKVSTETKTKFDYDIGTGTLLQQKNNDDVGGYLITARQQLDRIATQLNNSSIDPVEKLKLENDATALQKNIDKYSSYGGFTKPKSGSSRAAAFKTTGFKTASSSKVPKIRGVKVAKASSPKLAKTRKLSVSKMPRIA